jgi:hypothetical protein
MHDYPGRLSQDTWSRIAAIFGCGVTVRQIQERRHNFAKPDLDRRPFTLAERRQVAALAIDYPGQWKWIATQLGGQHRSAAMVKHCGTNVLSKLKTIRFDIQTPGDIALVSDAVFEHGFSKGAAGRALLGEFDAKKAQHGGAEAGGKGAGE